MIRPGEIRKANNQIQFSLVVLESAQLRLKTDIAASDFAVSNRADELNLSGSHLLVGISALCALGMLIWMLLRLWLFEQ